MNNSLNQKFTFWKVIKFTIPTMVMMVFMSLYTIVDGVFVSRLVGTEALSAVNIVFPVMNFVLAVAIMLATGASAIIGKKVGEGKFKEAKENFTFITLVGLAVGIVISIVGIVFLEPMIYALGANDVIFQYCYEYSFVLLFFIPSSILQLISQYLLVTAGMPKLGLLSTIAGGIANIVLDYVFIALFDMGIAGAALATGIGYSIPAVVGIVYFWRNTSSYLKFTKPKWDSKVLKESCLNGSSEMVTNLSGAIITYLFNIVMMRNLGENGVAAITIVLYVEFLLLAVYLGYSQGIAPVISFNYGKKDPGQLKKLFKISIIFLSSSSLLVFIVSLLIAEKAVLIFTPRGTEVYELALRGFYLYSFSYLFKGINIFASALFTAFSNGKISAVLSFFRSLVFITAGIFILSKIAGIDGVWLAVPCAETLALIMSVKYMMKYKNIYQY